MNRLHLTVDKRFRYASSKFASQTPLSPKYCSKLSLVALKIYEGIKYGFK